VYGFEARGGMGFDDQFYAASKRLATDDLNEDPTKRARREEKARQKELERKTKVGAWGGETRCLLLSKLRRHPT